MTQELTPPLGWQGIERAPDLDRVMVCGWQKPSGRTVGYWWWYEDVICEGRAMEHPDALYWCPVILPAFPPPPTEQANEGCSSRKGILDV